MHRLSRRTSLVLLAMFCAAGLSGVLAVAGKPGGGQLPPVGPSSGVIYFWDVGLDPIIGAPGWPCKINPDGTGYQVLPKDKGLGKSAARSDWDVSRTSSKRFFVYRDQVTNVGALTAANEDGSIECPLTSAGGEVILGSRVAISPNDQRLAYYAGGKLNVADLVYGEGGVPIALGNPVLANALPGGYYAWSPDGTQIASSDGEIFVVTLPNGLPVNITNSPDVMESATAWSPLLSNGTSRIAYVATDRWVSPWPIQTRLPDGSGLVVAVERVNSGVSFHRFPSWSPDGTQIAFNAIGGGGGSKQTQAVMRSAADGSTSAFNVTGFSRQMQICRVHWRP